MHTYIMSFQRVCCWFAGAIDLGVLSGVEPCADVIVSAAVRRRFQNIGARRRGRGGGERFLTWRLLTWEFCPGSSRAPTSLCRRPRTNQFWSAGARRRSQKIGAAARCLNCNIYRRPRRGGEAARRRRGGAAGRCGYATAAAGGGRGGGGGPKKFPKNFVL